MKDGYTVLIRYCNIDNIYVATVPELEGCMAHGETPEEALREIVVAKSGWMKVAAEQGFAIPDPMAYSA